jgi:hypothetical protein
VSSLMTHIQLQSLSRSIRSYLLRLRMKEEADVSEMPKSQKISTNFSMRMFLRREKRKHERSKTTIA